MTNPLFEAYKRKYLEYIDTLAIRDEVKYTLSNPSFVDKNPDFYLYYPKLFADYFEIKDTKALDSICFAGFLYYQSILFLDALVDTQKMTNIALMNICQEEAIKLLCQVFDNTSEFWNYWANRKHEYFTAIHLEHSLQQKERFTMQEYEQLADWKAAYGKVALDALHVMSQQRFNQQYEMLLKNHTLFSVGYQIKDDIMDFEEDCKQQQPNYALQLTAETLNIRKITFEKIEFYNKIFYVKGIANQCYDKSYHYFQKALQQIVEQKQETPWQHLLRDFAVIMKNRIEMINGSLLLLKRKIKLEAQKKEINAIVAQKFLFEAVSPNHKTIERLFNALLQFYKDDWIELKHWMYLSRADNFSGNGIHVGDIFQRAIITDILMDFADKMTATIYPLIRSELDYLISKADKTKIKAWKYFPTVKEIAPDTDDLGQILQVLCRNDEFEVIKNYASDGIKILLKDGVCSVNSVPTTWIIPKSKNKTQKKQHEMNVTKWGTGPDVEVVANFLYALWLLDKEYYKEYLDKGKIYIISQIETEGYWKSRWYYGKFYGTYVCCRFLKAIQCEDAFVKVQTFLLKTQNEDGGWHWNAESESDLLSTSFAILTFDCMGTGAHILQKNKDKAVQFLVHANLSFSEKLKIPFIMPKIGEPFSSGTITIAYMLKAFLTLIPKIKS